MRLFFDSDEDRALLARRLACGNSDRELTVAAERFFNGKPATKPAPRLTARQYEQLQERLNDPWDTMYAGAGVDIDHDQDNTYYGKG